MFCPPPPFACVWGLMEAASSPPATWRSPHVTHQAHQLRCKNPMSSLHSLPECSTNSGGAITRAAPLSMSLSYTLSFVRCTLPFVLNIKLTLTSCLRIASAIFLCLLQTLQPDSLHGLRPPTHLPFPHPAYCNNISLCFGLLKAQMSGEKVKIYWDRLFSFQPVLFHTSLS